MVSYLRKQVYLVLCLLAAGMHAEPAMEYAVRVKGGFAWSSAVQELKTVHKPAAAIGIDITAVYPSGFTMLLAHSTYLQHESPLQPIQMTTVSSTTLLNLLFGYTYRYRALLEYSIAAGIGSGFPPHVRLILPMQSSITVYLTENTGLCFSLAEHFSPQLPIAARFTSSNTVHAAFGIVFRF